MLGVLLIVVLVALAGCGEDEPAGGGAGLTGELRYVRSGGFDGDRNELTVQPGGAATLTSRRKGEKRFQLDEQALASISAEADGLEPVDALAPRPAPDAFTYTVTYAGATARTDDPTLKSSGLAPLIGALEKVLAARTG